MVIGIDARLINETGVGRYIRNLIKHLGEIDEEHRYIVFLRKNSYDSYSPPNDRWEKRIADVPWHSASEQFIMPLVFWRAGLDLLHVPYFNVPIFYLGSFVVTMHDIIIHHVSTGKATTLPFFLYKIRRLGYRVILKIGLLRAKKIIAVSGFTKQDIVQFMPRVSAKIAVIYQGVDSGIVATSRATPVVDENYFLYVGNAYPHKNLLFLLAAFDAFVQKKGKNLTGAMKPKLVLVGEEDFFYRQLMNDARHFSSFPRLVFYGPAQDLELASLYRFAKGFIYPSLMEGFGLPPLEALVNRTPVAVSDIPVFREILGDAPLYFNPANVSDLVARMELLWDNTKKVKEALPAPTSLLSKFKWEHTASATLREYNACLK